MPKRITERTINDREVTAPPSVEPVSLCATCDSVETCVFFKEHRGAIQYCEEYLAVQNAPATELKVAPETKPSAGTDAKGLCVNCQKLPTCVFTRPAEGVWHCEEYA